MGTTWAQAGLIAVLWGPNTDHILNGITMAFVLASCVPRALPGEVHVGWAQRSQSEGILNGLRNRNRSPF